MHDMDMAAAQRLKRAREAAGFATATDAATRFRWKVPTYLGHENGSRGFRGQTAAKYAKAFRVSQAWLLTGEGQGSEAVKNEVVDEFIDLLLQLPSDQQNKELLALRARVYGDTSPRKPAKP